MKVILKQDYELLGDAGQIVDVKNGYARNFLIPKGIATSANKSNLKSFEEIKKQQSKKIEKLVGESQKIASDLASHLIEITVKTGEDDRIFGSVTSQMIYDKLIEKGFSGLDRKKIILKEAIKTLGEHELDVKLQHSVVAKIKVNVIKESLEQEKTESETEEKSE